MRIWVAGAGAVGCVVGALAVRSGCEVVFLDEWSEQIEAIRAGGLMVRTPAGASVAKPAVALLLRDLHPQMPPPDIVMLAVKSYETAATVEVLAPQLGPTTPVLSLQNCLNEYEIAASIGVERTLGGVSLYDGAVLEPGVVTRQRDAGKIVVGEFAGKASPRVARLGEALRPYVTVEVTDNVIGLLWSKLVRNVMTNPLSAITGFGNGELVRNGVTRRLAVLLGAETVAVGSALGVPFDERELHGVAAAQFVAPIDSSDWQAVEDAFRREYADYPDMRPAMLQDLQRGRPTEIDHMNGYVVAQGAQVGVPTPVNAAVIDLVRAVARDPAQRPRAASELTALLARHSAPLR